MNRRRLYGFDGWICFGESGCAGDAGRAKFQAKQARVKVTLPDGTKSKVSDTAEKGKSRLQELDEQIAKATKERDGLKAELGGGAGHSIKYGDDVRNIKLNKAGVVGTPGSGFGPAGEGYFRLTAFGTTEQTTAAIDRIRTLF